MVANKDIRAWPIMANQDIRTLTCDGKPKYPCFNPIGKSEYPRFSPQWQIKIFMLWPMMENHNINASIHGGNQNICALTHGSKPKCHDSAHNCNLWDHDQLVTSSLHYS